MTLDKTMSKVLEHVGATMSKEEVAAEFVERILDGSDIDDLHQMAECHLEEEYEKYTKAELRDQMVCFDYTDLLDETELWEHEEGVKDGS
jgi:signal recognition particle GTPase